ncbi:MAG: amidohydrolase [Phenylobacterium sp.]|uniref:amidohydrolase n=1 Tax=Phenylobacterium sp. TaxID=1871053 RepID=UPI0025FDD28F|nr:amidohydrolase [Phenylobacterium sp.]MBI1198345.1 amidohydrolase [Phenylobacterium sp.]
MIPFRILRRSLLAAGAALALTAPAQARDVTTDKAFVDGVLDRSYAHLDALYKDIHQHPELGMQETATAAKLAKEMRALGFEVTEKVGGTGIVAIYRNGPGPMVLVRTEMDALPMEEKTGLPYESHVVTTWNGKPTPVDHACGHDIHMAAWVGTATALVAMKAQWHGTLMFVGQPAEETTQGARAMLADGLYQRFGKPDYGFALHVGPAPAGTVQYRAGAYSSNSDSLEITFHGRGAHGSTPNESVDPVIEAARFVTDVQTVISREKDPGKFGVISIGAIQTGSAGNIIPDTAILRGTIRSHETEVREKLLEGIRRTASAVAAMSGAPAPDVDIEVGGRAVINDADLTARTAPVFQAAFGDKATVMPTPINPSEDYSEFIIAGAPSLFFSIGGYDPKLIAEAAKRGELLPGNHNPGFAPTPEPSIRTGVEAMSLAVLNVMAP